MPEILVLGLGNSILRDEGLGVRACERLVERYSLPAGVAVREGGTLGPHLLPDLEGVRDLLVVDAVRADGPPGTLVRREGEALAAALAPKASLHQFGLAELLALAGLLGAPPRRVVLWGMVPAAVEPGLELTAPVAAALDALADAIAGELRAWGAPTVAR
ncbi:MAG TPA: hydrogenase maturation protease [Chloroflexaceae bacterium]|nr:hydrogenase maturation protease [Chloroflexaceae bacterium]